MGRKLRVVNCINESSLDVLRLYLDERGFSVYELDGEQIRDAESFFVESVKVFPQDPPLSGKVNWDAFVDSVWGGLDKLRKQRVAFIWTKAERMLERGLSGLLTANQCFEQLASTVNTPKYGISVPVTLLVFLVGEGSNFRQFELEGDISEMIN